MGYSKEVYIKADEILAKRRQKAFYDVEKRRDEIYAKIPRVREIEQLLTRTGIAAAKAVLAGSDTKTELIKLRDENLKLQGELKVLLLQNGYTTADLEEQFMCPMCKDRGYIDGKMCSCTKKILRDVAFRELNALSPLSLSSFDTFNLDYYSNLPDSNGNIPRKRLTNIYNYCRTYAENFGEDSESIFMQGATGLGKTHLSLAIASKVIEKGYGVIYCSAQNILKVLNKEYFSRDTTTDTLRYLEECDLLIFDDLGTEYTTPFSTSTVYNLFNTRMSRGKPIIVNTNLSLTEVKKIYSDRLVSRMMGDHTHFQFIGEDVRIARKRMNGKK